MMSDYLVQVKIKNARLMKAIRQAGFPTAASFAKELGICNSRLCALLSFKEAPMQKDGMWRPYVMQICDYLHKMPCELFPEKHQSITMKKNNSEFTCSYDELKALPTKTPEQLLLADEINQRLLDKINSLQERTAYALKRYYGLMGDNQPTMRELGKEMGISVERVRQIMMRGTRRLKKYDEFNVLYKDLRQLKQINDS